MGIPCWNDEWISEMIDDRYAPLEDASQDAISISRAILCAGAMISQSLNSLQKTIEEQESNKESSS